MNIIGCHLQNDISEALKANIIIEWVCYPNEMAKNQNSLTELKWILLGSWGGGGCKYRVNSLPEETLLLKLIYSKNFYKAVFMSQKAIVNLQVDASLYKLDKPVIIGEFSQKRGGFMTSPEQFLWAYDHGYSGAWSWCALDADSASDDIETQMRGMSTLRNKDDQSKGGRVNINIRNQHPFMHMLYFVVLYMFSPLGQLFSLFFI